MAVGRAAIILPYPHHRDRQQFHNARVLERVGAAIIQEEAHLDPAALTQLIESLLLEPSRLRAMADQGRKLRRLDAVDAILEDVRREVSGEDAVSTEAGSNHDPIVGSRPAERGAAARRGGVA